MSASHTSPSQGIANKLSMTTSIKTEPWSSLSLTQVKLSNAIRLRKAYDVEKMEREEGCNYIRGRFLLS